VLVWENRWAAPVAVALRRSGGQLVASGRIPIQAIVAALDATDGPGGAAGYDGAAARCRARMRRTGVSVSGASTTTVRANRSCSPRRRSSKSTMK